jgi:hypothetical protein
MAASDSLQPEQLKMFMTPKEIMSSHKNWDRLLNDPDGSKLYAYKLHEAKTEPTSEAYRYDVWAAGRTDVLGPRIPPMYRTLYESVKAEGVKKPVHLSPNYVVWGHHRIAAANDIDPNMLIPVKHYAEDRLPDGPDFKDYD